MTNLGQGGLFQSQHSCHQVISSVVIQVIVFLLDNNLKVALRACSLPFDDGREAVLKMWFHNGIRIFV
jgi:hypothetical protein